MTENESIGLYSRFVLRIKKWEKLDEDQAKMTAFFFVYLPIGYAFNRLLGGKVFAEVPVKGLNLYLLTFFLIPAAYAFIVWTRGKRPIGDQAFKIIMPLLLMSPFVWLYALPAGAIYWVFLKIISMVF